MGIFNYVELIGYIASALVAVSVLMSSLLKLRWINLVGAGVFSVYGIFISSLPVTFMNIFIVFVNIFYLVKTYTSKEYFKVMEIPKYDKYLEYFLDYYKDDIKKFFPKFNFDKKEEDVRYYILCNMVTAGVFFARELDKETLIISLDYIVREYRDFKIGKDLYKKGFC